MKPLFCILLCILSLTRGIEIAPDVVGINSTVVENAPWIVSLQMEEGDNAYCGATLISSITTESKKDSNTNDTFTAKCSGWIATTISCTRDVPLPVIATLGKYNLSSDTDHKTWSVSKFITFEGYNYETRENDIALFNVEYEVTKELANNETDKAKVLCEDEVPALKYWSDYKMNETHHRMTHNIYKSINATVYGWGLRNEDGPLQTLLYNLTIPLKRDQDCANDYDHETFFPQSMICAGSANNGPCSYDTGGPLVCDYIEDSSEEEKKNDTYLCGIVSFGLGCGRNGKPAIFTDVTNTHIYKWINDTIYANTPEITTTATPIPTTNAAIDNSELFISWI